MSIKIHQQRIIKLNQKEYDLILFVREKMPFGKCILVTHEGMPIRVENINPAKVFGSEDREEERIQSAGK